MLHSKAHEAFMVYLACGDLRQASEVSGVAYHLVERSFRLEKWERYRKLAIAGAERHTFEKLKKRLEKKKITHQTFMLDELDQAEEYLKRQLDPVDEEGKFHPDIFSYKQTLLDRHDQIARRVTGLEKEEEKNPMREGLMLLIAAQSERDSLTNGNPILELPSPEIPSNEFPTEEKEE